MLCWWIVSTVCVHMQLTDLQVEWTSLLLVSQFRGTCHRGISIRIDGSAVAAHGRQFYPLQHCSQRGLSSHRAVVLLKVFWAFLFVCFLLWKCVFPSFSGPSLKHPTWCILTWSEYDWTHQHCWGEKANSCGQVGLVMRKARYY